MQCTSKQKIMQVRIRLVCTISVPAGKEQYVKQSCTLQRLILRLVPSRTHVFVLQPVSLIEHIWNRKRNAACYVKCRPELGRNVISCWHSNKSRLQ